MTALPQPPNLAGDALRALATAGPLTFDELAGRLGLDAGDIAFDRVVDELLEDEGRVAVLAGDRVADAVTMVAATTLTHRITEAEAAGGWLDGDGDLGPLAHLADRGVPLARGGRVTVESFISDRGVPALRLAGPPGWLPHPEPGTLVGLRLAGGVLEVAVGVEPRADDAPARALAEGARRALALQGETFEDGRASLGDVLWEALAAEPDACAGVLPPLTELADRAGLNRLHEMVAAPGEPWPEAGEPPLALVEALYGLGPAEAEVLHALRVARLGASGSEPDADAVERAAAGFADPVVLSTYLGEQGVDEAGVALARALRASAGGAALAGACVVLARDAEARGDALAGERLLGEALAADPDHELALTEAAWYAADRGEARRALGLLGRAGFADGVEASVLRGVVTATASGAGRNDPCPCGSGRKYKRCCAQREGGALPARAGWLAHKLASYVARPTQWPRVRPLAEARMPDPGPGWRQDAVADPLVADLAAFDLGLLDEFLAARGPLLPGDEAELAGSWRETRRAVYRVERRRGPHLELTDVSSGATSTARAGEAAGLEPGEHLLGRLVPSGDGEPLLLWGPVRLGPVPDTELLTVEDPVDLAGQLAAGRQRLRTTEGQPLVLCDLRWALPDGAAEGAVAGALAMLDELERDEEDAGVLRELAEVAGQVRVRGTVTVAGGEVHVDTNARARADRLRALVEGAVPGLRLLWDRRTPAWQALEDQRRFGVPPEPSEPSADERAMLAEFLRVQEERWVDEPVPALGGLTPREALSDPAQRANLERLLDDPVGMFDHERLRTLLGMEGTMSSGEGMEARERGSAGDDDADERRRFAATPGSELAPGSLGGLLSDIDLTHLDPHDEDDRGLLIQAEHSDLAEALEQDLESVPGPDGQPISPALHFAMHELVANQLWHDDPPEVWQTARRLVAAGYERHEVLHMLARCNGEALWVTLNNQREFDIERLRALLEALPESWEDMRARPGPDQPWHGRPPGRGRGRRRPPGAGH